MPEGLALLKESSEGGVTGAMHALGLIYINGANVHANEVEARKWFTMRAEHNIPGDIYNVGLMDWRGAGGIPRPNRQSAMALWRRAA